MSMRRSWKPTASSGARSRRPSCPAAAPSACGRSLPRSARRAPPSPRRGTASPASQERARHREPLLLAERQGLGPGPLLVEAIDEVRPSRRRAGPRRRRRDRRRSGPRRIDDGVAQRADRDVGPLRQEHHARPRRASGSAPSPNGQMPAMARNSVDLPEPEGPVTSALSPGRKREPGGVRRCGARRAAQRKVAHPRPCRARARQSRMPASPPERPPGGDRLVEGRKAVDDRLVVGERDVDGR